MYVDFHYQFTTIKLISIMMLIIIVGSFYDIVKQGFYLSAIRSYIGGPNPVKCDH